jgi:glutamate racemase|tara:strand:- start:783 stop:1592 length:810 start_codon:yes stop_codon:yes gene_type:complete
MNNIFIDNKDDRPIGVFDSGLGGLTVLNDLAKSFPNQSYIYLGDLANLPYGNKSKNNIIKCSVSCANFLIEKNVKGVIIACNTSSSYAYKKLKESLSIPVYDVINPCAESVSKSNLKKIAIIGTEKTIESNLYFDIIQSLNKKIQIYNVACPLFVPIVEEGLENSSIAISVINMYLKKLKKLDIEGLVLGCTHYPVLIESLKSYFNNSIKIFKSGKALADKYEEPVASIHNKNKPVKIKYYVTDLPDRFVKYGNKFSFQKIKKAELIKL